jgi:hypothetical protein
MLTSSLTSFRADFLTAPAVNASSAWPLVRLQRKPARAGVRRTIVLLMPLMLRGAIRDGIGGNSQPGLRRLFHMKAGNGGS